MICSQRTVGAFIFLFAATAGNTQTKPDPLTTEGYILPPKDILSAVTAPWYRNVTVSNLSPDRTRFLSLERDGNITIAGLGRQHVNLGGFQVDTGAQRERAMNSRTGTGIRIVQIPGGSSVSIKIPADARVSDPTWSPDGSKVAYYAHLATGTFLCVADPATGASTTFNKFQLKPTMATGYEWVDGGHKIVAVIRPLELGEAPQQSVASSPRVQQSDQVAKRIRSFPDLLESTYEKTLLEYYAMSQLATIDVASGAVTNIGHSAMIRSFSPSPDGKFFRVTVMNKPFSYVVPVSSFGSKETIWDDKGAEKAVLSTRNLQLTEAPDPTQTPPPAARPAGGAGGRGRGARGPADKRFLSWRPDGAGLSFVQTATEDSTEDGGAPIRVDRLMLWTAPYGEKDMKAVYEYEGTIANVRYSDDAKIAFVDVTADNKTQLLAIDLATKKGPKLADVSTDATLREDLVTTTNKLGLPVVRRSSDGKSVYFSATKQPSDALKDGPWVVIDKLEIGASKRENVFTGRKDVYEVPAMLDNDAKELLVTRQTANTVPNTYLLKRAEKTDVRITDNQDYSPDLTNLKRETIIVTRADGFKFQAKVTLPRYATYGVRMPAFFWFYPAEFTSQEAYDRSKRAGNKNLFHQVTGNNKEILARAGYVVVEPDCPIVGLQGRMNDEYVPQLRNGLLAVIDELDRRGWIDRNRLGIGGHSYGAFSTANALVNTPFFKAGIAGDGCYNRTLTPFGFQNEQRQIWDDKELYMDMSPMLKAEQMTGALLMYHGMEDQNVGTAPINSERMYAAMEALGKPAALYMYPYEDHGQIAKETILDQWARFVAWLDKWVKNPQPAVFPLQKEPTTPAAGRRGGGRVINP